MLKTNFLKSVVFTSVTAVALFALVLPASAGATRDHHKTQKKAPRKVTICHRTNSVTNRYRQITISYNAFNGNKKSDHTSHHGPFAYSEDFARELKKKHIKWGDVVDASKCAASQKKKHYHKHTDKKDCKPKEQPKQQAPTPEKPADTPKKEEPKAVLATNTPKTPTPPAAKVLADTGISAVMSTLAAFAIIGTVTVTFHASRMKKLAA